MGAAALIEVVAGALIAVGLMARPAAFIASGEMDLEEGDFTTHLVNMRATYTMTPAMFVSALTQRFPGLVNRVLIVKVNRLFRF